MYDDVRAVQAKIHLIIYEFIMRKHPYHLVDPSPWPLFAGLAAFVTTIGAVMYFHAYVGGGLICSFGLLMILYSMFVWWRDSARGCTLWYG